MRTTLRQFIEFLEKLESGIKADEDKLIYQTFIGNDTNTGYSIMEFYREPGGNWIMKDGSFKGLEIIINQTNDAVHVPTPQPWVIDESNTNKTY